MGGDQDRVVSRPVKQRPVDIVRYEIKMLNYCYERVGMLKKANDAQDEEFWLSIEGFLLHFRVLSEFLSAQGRVPASVGKARLTKKDDDLDIFDSSAFEGLLSERQAQEIAAAAKPIWDKYRENLNKYLAHLTVVRLKPQDWRIDEMKQELSDSIEKFERVLSFPSAQSGRLPDPFEGYSTATRVSYKSRVSEDF
jgi:hypothetical protein